MMINKYRRWTRTENELIKKIYNDFPNEELGKIFNRSLFKISRHARKLGLKKDKKVMALNLSNSLKEKGTNRREKNPHWRGGSYKDVNGYIRILKPENPNANSQGYVLEHRLIAGESLGRNLKKEERVHHLNGDKTDNRPDNLAICKTDGEHIKKYHLKTVVNNFSKSPTHIKNQLQAKRHTITKFNKGYLGDIIKELNGVLQDL